VPRIFPFARFTVGLLVLVACVHAEPPRARISSPRVAPASASAASKSAKSAKSPNVPTDWRDWRPIELDLHAAGNVPLLPLADTRVARIDGADSRWARLSTTARESLRTRGFAVVPPPSAQAAPTRFGAFYKHLADDRVPFVVTLDALTGLAHVALSRALAEAEDRELSPALGTMLVRLDAHLSAERRDARSEQGDLAPAYAMAHGIVAVARALADAAYALPPDLAPFVEGERRRVVAHAGREESLILGDVVDYAALAPRAALEENHARAGLYRALAWLGHVPLLLLARSEAPGSGSHISVSHARTQARAALLLARLFDAEVDRDIADAWATLARAAELVGGAPDDIAPSELVEIARSVGVDVCDPRSIENVVLFDKVRHAAANAHETRLYDGAGSLAPAREPDPNVDGGVRSATLAGNPFTFPRASLAMRIAGARGVPDAAVFQRLVWPSLGVARAQGERRRTLPSCIDVAAWLGSAEAREVSRVTNDPVFAGYSSVLDTLIARRRDTRRDDSPESRHLSLYASGLEVVATYLSPSAGDRAQPYASTGAWRNRKIEVALGLWTVLRHDGIAFARKSLGLETAERGAPAATRGFVEVHPEAIGELLALVRQTESGLARLARVPKSAPGKAVLAEVEELLTGCLRVALREANDEPLGADDDALLASFPARVDALDARLGRSGEAEAPLIVDVHVDLDSARVLEEARGALDDLYLVMREPGSGRLILAIGASSSHYEFTEPALVRLTDDAWRARLRAGGAPPRHAFSMGYVIDDAPPR
jgi:hypothetical protein